MNTITEKPYVKIRMRPLVAFTAIVALFFTAIQQLFSVWIDNDVYSHAFLMLPLIGYMTYKSQPRYRDEYAIDNLLGLAIFIFAMILYHFAEMTLINTIIFSSLYLAIFGIILFVYGLDGVKRLTFPILCALIIFPIPTQLYIKITFPLQVKVSELSQLLTTSLGITVLREGNVIHVPGKVFEVVEACSGIRSIMSLLSLALVISHFYLTKASRKAILLATCIPISIIINVLRVSALILAYTFFQYDLSEGVAHTAVGLASYSIGLVLLYAVYVVTKRSET